MAKLRILLGDDHTLLRHGLRKILQERPSGKSSRRPAMVAKRCASAGRPAQYRHPRHWYAVVNGIDATSQMVRRLPDIRVLILSMHAEEAYIIQALNAGAKGYLLKDSADTELIRAWPLSRPESRSSAPRSPK